MSNRSCCVVNCKNKSINKPNIKFYSFPTAKHKLLQRKKWIEAIRKSNPLHSAWSPKSTSRICSQHFIGNKRSEEEISPSYVPSIFGTRDQNAEQKGKAALGRHARFMRRYEERMSISVNAFVENNVFQNISITEEPLEESVASNSPVTYADQGCHVGTYPSSTSESKEFNCGRYFTYSHSNDVGIQTDMIRTGIVKIPNTKQFKDKACNTEQKILVDKEGEVHSEMLDTADSPTAVQSLFL